MSEQNAKETIFQQKIRTYSKSTMRQALMKVLGSMKMEEPSKVLIAIKLQTDEQIITFLKWLKKEVPESQVEARQDEIVNKAIEIAK